MLGHAAEDRPAETAALAGELGENDRRQDYLRATLSFDSQGRRLATPFQRQDSSMLATLAHADCLIVRAPHAPPGMVAVVDSRDPVSGSVSRGYYLEPDPEAEPMGAAQAVAASDE